MSDQWQSDFGSLLSALSDIEGDLKTNAPLPPPEQMTAADALAALEGAQAKVTTAAAWIVAHPGVYWAARRVLSALAAMPARARPSWAADALAALKAAPGMLVTAATWLPRITEVMKATQPAPRGGPPITEGSWWQGPQSVDNPSGAIGGSTEGDRDG